MLDWMAVQLVAEPAMSLNGLVCKYNLLPHGCLQLVM
jgi:hypothetical protein